jgi:hypothetical protein
MLPELEQVVIRAKSSQEENRGKQKTEWVEKTGHDRSAVRWESGTWIRRDGRRDDSIPPADDHETPENRFVRS